MSRLLQSIGQVKYHFLIRTPLYAETPPRCCSSAGFSTLFDFTICYNTRSLKKIKQMLYDDACVRVCYFFCCSGFPLCWGRIFVVSCCFGCVCLCFLNGCFCVAAVYICDEGRVKMFDSLWCKTSKACKSEWDWMYTWTMTIAVMICSLLIRVEVGGNKVGPPRSFFNPREFVCNIM